MRAKNEFRYIAETYDTKLILERIVDGKLMCPEACCGAPVVECTCGPDCPHCNCFMIHKAMKSKGFTNKLLKEYYEVEDDDYNPVLNAAARSIIGTTVTLSSGHTGKVVDVDVQSGYMVVKTVDGNTFKAELGDDDIKYEDEEVVSEGILGTLLKKFKPKPDVGEFVPKPGATVRLGPAQAAAEGSKIAPIVKGAAAKAGVGLGKAATGYTVIDDFVTAPTAHAPGVDQPGKWSILDRQTHSATGRPAPTKSIISKTKDLIPTISVNEQRDLSGGWESSRDRAGEMEAKEERMREKIAKIRAKRKDREFADSLFAKSPEDQARSKRAAERVLGKRRNPRPKHLFTKDENNEEPKRSITGMRQKLDALAAAQLAGSKHKPYVSSFVGDGGKKIFAILGSDGKIVHKTHDKREAHQWLKDNYENI